MLQDLAYISDWLLAVRSSPSLGPFASLVSRVRRCIFTPQQSRTSRAAAEAAASSTRQQAERGRGGRQQPVLSSRDSKVKRATAAGSGSMTHDSALRSPAASVAPAADLPSPPAAAAVSSSPPPALSGDSEDEGAESESEELDGLPGLEERLSAFAELKEAADESELSFSSAGSGSRHSAQQPSLAPLGVLFMHGRWISQQAAASPPVPAPFLPRPAPPAQPQPAPLLQPALSPSSPAAISVFPDDLDALPDWPDDDGEAEAEEEAGSGAAGQQQDDALRPSSASSASASRSSLHTAASTQSDDWDEPEPLADSSEQSAPAAVPPSTLSPSSSSRPPSLPLCSPQLAEKLRQFPDDTTVAELKQLDDDDEDAGAHSSEEEKEGGDGRWSGLAVREAEASEAVGAPAAAASRLRNRLLRVSMGGAERFPHDIDRLEAADDAQQPQQPQQPPAPSRSPLRSIASPSSSFTPSPFSRVLNEFSLSPSLLAELRLQEQQHRRADATAPQLSAASISRALQLSFIMQQAGRTH